MTITLQDKLDQLPAERRAKVEARAAALIAEELTLRDLRRAREQTQVRLAERMGVKQETISRLEKRSDMLLSTLREYVAAMDGELELVVRFSDRPPIRLKSISQELPSDDATPPERPGRKARKKAA